MHSMCIVWGEIGRSLKPILLRKTNNQFEISPWKVQVWVDEVWNIFLQGKCFKRRIHLTVMKWGGICFRIVIHVLHRCYESNGPLEGQVPHSYLAGDIWSFDTEILRSGSWVDNSDLTVRREHVSFVVEIAGIQLPQGGKRVVAHVVTQGTWAISRL